MKWLTAFFIIVFITACSNRTSIPNGIIPMDSMRNILKDVMVADAYADQYVSKDSTKKDKIKANQELLEAIFKVHHVTRAEFKSSLSFYESRPDLNKIIFDSLAVYANQQKAEQYTPRPVKSLSDSLTKKDSLKPHFGPLKNTGLPLKPRVVPLKPNALPLQ